MGGEIGVESIPGDGSTFWFTIKVGVVDSESPDSEHIGASVSNTASLTGKRILFVDDNATNRRVLARKARHWGMLPNVAEDALSALKQLRLGLQHTKPYDLVVIDADLPGMSGFDLSAIIPSDVELSYLPIVMLIAYGHRSDSRRAHALGISGYLTKPVREAPLLETLTTILKSAASTFSLLRNQSEQGEDAVCLLPYTIPQQLPSSSKPRILIAEDNVVNQKVTRHQVEMLGYLADVVANGWEVMEALSRIRYDVVLMDCQMPELDGYQATARIRDAETQRSRDGFAPDRIPIIAITANVIARDREMCLAAGMDDYISKPTDVETLRWLLDHWTKSNRVSLCTPK